MSRVRERARELADGRSWSVYEARNALRALVEENERMERAIEEAIAVLVPPPPGGQHAGVRPRADRAVIALRDALSSGREGGEGEA